jgi:hypothetical protein
MRGHALLFPTQPIPLGPAHFLHQFSSKIAFGKISIPRIWGIHNRHDDAVILFNQSLSLKNE